MALGTVLNKRADFENEKASPCNDGIVRACISARLRGRHGGAALHQGAACCDDDDQRLERLLCRFQCRRRRSQRPLDPADQRRRSRQCPDGQRGHDEWGRRCGRRSDRLSLPDRSLGVRCRSTGRLGELQGSESQSDHADADRPLARQRFWSVHRPDRLQLPAELPRLSKAARPWSAIATIRSPPRPI